MFTFGERNKFGGVWKYLTFLNMLLQFIFFIVAVLANFVKSLRPTRDLVFASAAFPIGMFVGIIFWTLYHIDRKLIFPVELDQYFPGIPKNSQSIPKRSTNTSQPC